MTLTDDHKLQAITDRRHGPEARLFGAQLDLKLAKAADDKGAAAEAQKRIDSETAQIKVLDEAEAAAK